MFLYHYYDKSIGPFVNLSDLPLDQAQLMLDKIKSTKPRSQSAKRNPAYVENRRRCEDILRRAFLAKGGLPERLAPHYMVVEHSPWLSTWYEESAWIKIPVADFDLRTVSFTYGDSMPTFSPTVNDGKEYRHKLYTYDEIVPLIAKYGLPQDWNDDGAHGPERYIEAHIWSNDTIDRFLRRTADE